MYGPPSDYKEKAEGEKTSLRKCIRPLVELSAPGQDELRAYLSLLVGRLSSTNSSSRFPGTRCDCSFVLAVSVQTSVGKLQARRRSAVKWERVSASKPQAPFPR